MLSIQELKTLTQKELLHELKNAHSEMMRIKMGVRTKSIKDSSLVNKQKIYIARIKTVLKELDMEELIKKADTL